MFRSHRPALAWVLALVALTMSHASVRAQPAEPEDGVVRIELEEVWRRGDFDDDLIFGVIEKLVEDDNGDLYLLDSQLHEIVVLDSSGEHLRTIGRQGEGPGEFQNPLDLCLGPAGRLGVVQVFPGKLIQLERDGSPAPLFQLPEVDGGGFQLLYVAKGLEDRILVGGGVSGQTQQENYLRALTPDGQTIATYTTASAPMQFGGMEFQEEVHRDFMRRWDVAPDGRVAAALKFTDYAIHVWDSDGELERVIERDDVPPVPRTDEERAMLKAFFEGINSWNPNSSYEVSQNHMAVGQVIFRSDGQLWVLPAAGVWRNSEGVLATYDVYDEAGVFRNRVELIGPGDASRDSIYFSEGRLYVVTDELGATMSALGVDDDTTDEVTEPMQIIAYDMK